VGCRYPTIFLINIEITIKCTLYCDIIDEKYNNNNNKGSKSQALWMWNRDGHSNRYFRVVLNYFEFESNDKSLYLANDSEWR